MNPDFQRLENLGQGWYGGWAMGGLNYPQRQWDEAIGWSWLTTGWSWLTTAWSGAECGTRGRWGEAGAKTQVLRHHRDCPHNGSFSPYRVWSTNCIFTEKNKHVRGPGWFKPMLFKGQQSPAPGF